MTAFTALEIAALHSIFAETPEITVGLQRQLESASVTSRENTGHGFFTHIAVADEVPPVDCPRVLGYQTHARVEGLELGMGFVLFMEDGSLHMFEGFGYGEDIEGWDLAALKFDIFKTDAQRNP